MSGRMYDGRGAWKNETTGNFKARFPVLEENAKTEVLIGISCSDFSPELIKINSKSHKIELLRYSGNFAVYSFETAIFYKKGEFELASGGVGIYFMIDGEYWSNFSSECVVSKLKGGEYGHFRDLVDYGDRSYLD